MVFKAQNNNLPEKQHNFRKISVKLHKKLYKSWNKVLMWKNPLKKVSIIFSGEYAYC